MKIKSVYPAILLLVTLSTSCNNNPVADSGSLLIDSPLLISMFEQIDSPERKFELRCVTTNEYACSNFGILFGKKTGNRYIEINFEGIQPPAICATALGPARALIEFGSLSKDHYRFIINIRGESTEYMLKVTEDNYIITDEENSWIKFENRILNRIPANALWGRIEYNDKSLLPAAASFIDSLRIIGASEHNFTPGYYGHFSLDSTGKPVIPEYIGTTYAESFIFLYNGNTNDLTALLEQYGVPYKNRMWIYVYDGSGNEYRNF